MSALQPSRPMRASDQDRHEAVLALSDQFAEGRLDREEFDRRMESASEATYLHELDPLFADLPARATASPAVTPRPHGNHPARGHRRGRPLFVVPFAVAVFLALAVLTGGHSLWLILPAWWIGASITRRMMWQRHMMTPMTHQGPHRR